MPVVTTGGVATITPPTAGFSSIPVSDIIDAVAQRMGRHARGLADGGSATTVITGNQGEADYYWDEHWLKCIGGNNNGKQYIVSAWDVDTTTHTVVPGNGLAWISGDEYRITPFNQLWMLTSGFRRGVIDKAIDLLYDLLFYEVANTGLTLVTNTYEYSFRSIASVETWIKTLRRVQYRVSGGYVYIDLKFGLVGDGSSFHLPSIPDTSSTIRLLGDGYVLRTNSSDTVQATLSAESDKIVIERGKEELLILQCVKIILTEGSVIHSVLDLATTEMLLAEAKKTHRQKHNPQPLRGIF